MSDVPLRQCRKCGEWWPETEEYFYRTRSWLCHTCKSCTKAATARYQREHPDECREYARRYRTRHQEKNRQRGRRYREEHPQYWAEKNRRWAADNPEKIKENDRRWRERHPEKVRAKKRRYYANHRQEHHRKSNEWAHNHPDYRRRAQQRRRARKAGLAATFTQGQWERAIDCFDGGCAVCGRGPDFWTILVQDHWIPLSIGGAFTAENIVPLCQVRRGAPKGIPNCNQSKNSKDPEVWLMERFGERKAKEILKRINAYFDWVREQDKA